MLLTPPMRSWSAQKITQDETQRSSSDPQPRASWYAQGFSDSIGDRLLMFDNSRGPSLELLRFSRRVAASADFENALRERVDVISQFSHGAFAKIRAVEKLEPQKDLTLVSNYVSGKRLSEAFVALRGPVFAMWVIREILPALADFEQHARGLAHGALNPDRIVVTPDGRLVIVEHALGSALERLQLTTDELWLRFGVAAPPTERGIAVLDARADVFQLAFVAVAVLLGRPVGAHEHPNRLAETLDNFEKSSGRELPVSLRSWLMRALHLAGQPFESAREAQNGLGELPEAPTNVELLGGSMFVAGARTIDRSEWALRAAEQNFDQPRHDDFEGVTEVSGMTWPPLGASRPNWPGDFARQPSAGLRSYVLIALVALAAAQAGYIAFLLYMKAPSIVVQPPHLEAASVAGIGQINREQPQPLTLQALTAEPRTRRPDTVSTSVARVRSGGVRLVSPVELQVLEGDRVLGSSADGPIVASAGRHEFEFVNSALGYRARRVVNLAAGEVVSLSLPHPEGQISINAIPWADVWIDNVHVGETPLANLSVPIGQHEVSFRHPSFGEQKVSTIVRHDAPARISADLR